MYINLKKLLTILLFTGLLMAAFIIPASADSGLITGSTVNVRSGPSVNYSVVSSLNKDTQVEVLEESNDWVKINTGSLTGWVYKSLINITKESIRLQVTENTVNLRSGPGTTYSQAGQAVQGDILTLLDVQDNWYKVKTSSGTVAFVRSDLVQKTDLQQVTMEVTSQVPTSASSSTASDTGAQTATSTAATDTRLQVTENLVNLRSGPGTAYSQAGQAVKGDMLTLVNVQGDWYKVKTASGTVAFVRSDLVQKNGLVQEPGLQAVTLEVTSQVPTSTSSSAASGTGTQTATSTAAADTRLQVTEPLVNLRSGPGTAYSQAGQAVKGDMLTLVNVQGDWYKVKTASGTVAFVRSDLVQKIVSQGATVSASTSSSAASGTGTQTLGSSTTVQTSQEIKVLLDNKQLTFDVAPVIENNRTLVPLRAIFEAMGATVEWQQDNNRAVATKGTTTVILALNSIHPTINGEQQTIDVPAKVVNQRMLAPLRFVGEAFGGQVTWDQAAFAVKMTSPVQEEPEEPVELSSLRLSRTWDTTGVKIFAEANEELDSKKTVSGNTITYEFNNFKIEGTTSISQIAGISAATTTQGSNVILNINIPAGIKYRTATENNGQQEVITIPNAITSVTRGTFGNGGEKISLNTISSFKYTTDQDDTRLVIELNNVLPGKAEEKYKFSSSLISSMTFTDESDQSDITVLTIKTTTPVKFAVGTSSDGTALYILFVDKSTLQSREPIVVLDAGHGGKDTGARGYAIEKDVNLAITLKAGEFLTENGVKVVYTHKDDTYLELDEISDIANMYNAELFVCIHNNSGGSSSASGTETYYYAPVERPDLFMQKDERCSLASLIQKYVVNAIGLPDRGVKTDNFAVLRNTQMPSALVECAFVNNPVEGTLLTQDDFQEKIGEAIAKAIMEYMKENVTS